MSPEIFLMNPTVIALMALIAGCKTYLSKISGKPNPQTLHGHDPVELMKDVLYDLEHVLLPMANAGQHTTPDFRLRYVNCGYYLGEAGYV
jgi:hypothetical protein